MNNNRNTYIIWILSVIVLALIAGIYFAVAQVQKITDEIAGVKQDIFSIEQISDGHRDRVAELERYKEKFDSVNLKTIDQTQPREFSQFIQSMAEKNNIIATTNLGSSDGSSDSAFFFKISANCSYFNCLSFLGSIEGSKWLLEAYNIRMSKDGAGKTLMSFEVKVHTKTNEG